MTRWILLLPMSILLAGCTLLFPEYGDMLTPTDISDRKTFDQHLEAFLATGDPASLDQYVADNPEGDYRARAQALSLFAHELKQCGAENLALVAASRGNLEKIDDLEEKNRRLNETIEQLKSLLIQLEQRAH